MFDDISISNVIIYFVAVLFSLSAHEASHATVAYRLSNGNAMCKERITLNPLSHIDFIGTILLPITGLLTNKFFIGWAKPVVFNQNLLTKKLKVKTSTAIIAAAGPLANIVLSFIFLVITTLYIASMESNADSRMAILTNVLIKEPTEILSCVEIRIEEATLLGLGGALVRMNLFFAVFNLIPVGPLDGAGILGAFLPDHLQYRYNAFRHSQLWLIGLMLFMSFGPPLPTSLNPAKAILMPIARLILGI